MPSSHTETPDRFSSVEFSLKAILSNILMVLDICFFVDQKLCPFARWRNIGAWAFFKIGICFFYRIVATKTFSFKPNEKNSAMFLWNRQAILKSCSRRILQACACHKFARWTILTFSRAFGLFETGSQIKNLQFMVCTSLENSSTTNPQ